MSIWPHPEDWCKPDAEERELARERASELAYRGTSPIKKRLSPQDTPRTLGIGLQ